MSEQAYASELGAQGSRFADNTAADVAPRLDQLKDTLADTNDVLADLIMQINEFRSRVLDERDPPELGNDKPAPENEIAAGSLTVVEREARVARARARQALASVKALRQI